MPVDFMGPVRVRSVKPGGKPVSTKVPDWWDQTGGALAFGAAEVGSGLSRYAGSWIEGEDVFDQIGRSLEDFKFSHPEYAPEEVDSVLELITNPKALAGRVFGSAPYLLATAGALAVPYAGLPLAGALSYAIESQRGYDQALADGAGDDDAKTAAKVKGVIGAAFNLIPVGSLFRFVKGGDKKLIELASRSALDQIKKTGAKGEAAKMLATQALFGVLQGSADELASLGVYGKPVEPGFLDRRLQEVVGATAAGAVFGLGGKALRDWQKVNGKPEQPLPEVVGPGDERIFYHGTDAKFDSFDLSKASDRNERLGIFGSSSLDEAKGYGRNIRAVQLNGRILDLKDPKRAEILQKVFEPDDNSDHILSFEHKGVVEKLKAMGYQGVVAPAGKNQHIMVWDPTALLSASEIDFISPGKRPEKQSPLTSLVLATTQRPGDPTVVDLASHETLKFPETLEAAGPEGGVIVEKLKGAWRGVKGTMHSLAAGLKDGDAKREVVDRLDNAEAYVKSVRGMFADRFKDAWLAAKEDKSLDWLTKLDSQGFSNKQKLIDPTSVPEVLRLEESTIPEGAKALRELYREKQEYQAQEAIKAETLRKNAKGRWEPFKPSKELKAERLWTPEFWRAIERGTGKTYNAIVNAIAQFNPDFGQFKDVDVFLREMAAKSLRREAGPLEEVRQIQYVPERVKVDGRWVEITEPSIHDQFYRGLDLQARATAINRMFGQGVLESPTRGLLKKTAETLGVMPEVRAEDVIQKLRDKGVELEKLESTKPVVRGWALKALQKRFQGLEPAFVEGMTRMSFGQLRMIVESVKVHMGSQWKNAPTATLSLMLMAQRKKNPWVGGKELRALADANEIETRVTEGQIVEAIKGARIQGANDLETEARVRKLRSVAKKLGGIAVDAEPEALLAAVQKRVAQKVEEGGLRRVVDRYAKEGGDPQDMITMLRLWQGVPVYSMGHGALARGAKFVSTVVGSLQTSLAALPNMPQVLVQGARYTGWTRLAQAIDHVVKSPEEARQMGVYVGAFPRAMAVWGSEHSFSLEKLGRQVREGMGLISGLRKVNEFQSVVAADAARLMAEDWKRNGLGRSEEWIAKELRLSDQEIADAKAGRMADHTFRKIVQNVVAETQYATEAPHRKSRLENMPLMRMLFAYNNYATGMLRNLTAFGSDVRLAKEAAKAGDIRPVLGTVQRGFMLLAGALGAGAATAILKQAVKGEFSKDQDDKVLDRGLGALAQVQILGTTQRMLDAFQYDAGIIDRTILGMMPQVKAVADLFGSLLGYGRYGRFRLDERLAEGLTRMTPAVRAGVGRGVGIDGWVNSVLWPDVVSYKRARAAVRGFEKETLGRSSSFAGEAQLNPEYFKVFEAVARGEAGDAGGELRKYLTARLRAGDDPQKALLALRSSLVNRAPIPLNGEDTVGFLAKLSPERRREFFRSHTKYMQIVDALIPVGD